MSAASTTPEAGVTQPINRPRSTRSCRRIRDPDGHWVAMTMRARVVYASKERVKQDAITYEELADPKWKGKICIRDGQHVYNDGLFAACVTRYGP